jgi:hypothetical protein
MAQVVAKGKEGEVPVGITRPKTGVRGPKSGKMRFPDELSDGLLKESKNVASQGLTAQIKDYIEIARARGIPFELWVRPETRLSKPLRDAWRRGEVIIKHLEGLAK